jgi:rubrerythrin
MLTCEGLQTPLKERGLNNLQFVGWVELCETQHSRLVGFRGLNPTYGSYLIFIPKKIATSPKFIKVITINHRPFSPSISTMNFFTQILHLVGSGAVAYITASTIRDPQTRPNLLAGFQLAESGSVPFLEALSQRAAAEGDEWLADKLSRHAQDERRHGQIFAYALKQLNKQVIDFKQEPQTTAAGKPNEKRRSPFFDTYFEGYSKESLSPEKTDWIMFFASTHILELDACKDFVRMANALPAHDSQSANLAKSLLSIAQDEKGHAAYLLEAMERRLPHTQVKALVDEWRTRKVNALLAMVGNLIQRQGQQPSLVQDGVPSEMSETLKSEALESEALALEEDQLAVA